MIRPVAAVLAALRIVAPHFPEPEAAARELCRLGAEHDFDPLTEVAYIKGESDWQSNAIGHYSSGVYVGLGQVRARDSQHQALLLDWRHNLAETAGLFAAWRSLCKVKTGSGTAVFWLQGMTGWDAKRHTVCGHAHGKPLPTPERVVKLLRLRRQLAARVAHITAGRVTP